jgi:hypothetical protein
MMTLIQVLGLAWVVLALLHHVVSVTALVVYSKCLDNYACFPRFSSEPFSERIIYYKELYRVYFFFMQGRSCVILIHKEMEYCYREIIFKSYIR